MSSTTPKGAGGPSDYSDANPVDPEHILSIMRANFPESALAWVKRAAWIGPVNWSRGSAIDHDDEAKWAAAHEPAKVRQFARDIKAGTAHQPVDPVPRQPGDGKDIVADGHHRAVARHGKLGKPVLAYVGNVPRGGPAGGRETHSSQFHRGATPRTNRRRRPSSAPCITRSARDSLWHTPDRHVPTAQRLPAYVENTALALQRDQGMGESEAIATAINAVKEWAAGRAFGGHVKVTPEVQQAAQRCASRVGRTEGAAITRR